MKTGGQLPRQNTDRSQKKDQEWKRGNQALKVRQPLFVSFHGSLSVIPFYFKDVMHT